MPEIVPAEHHNPQDEKFARTVHCASCNAAPGIACHCVRWVDRRFAVAVPRTNESGTEIAHAQRLKDARRMQAMREKKSRV